MNEPGTDLIRKASIEELCGHRSRALELYEQAYRTLLAAREAHARACVGKAYIGGDFLRKIEYPEARHMAGWLADVRKTVDRDMWHGFILNTPLGSLMDREERGRFERDLRDNPPEATADTVFATMSRLAAEAGVIFRRGLVNAFRSLSRQYQSHDGFKIGDRVVLTYSFSVYPGLRPSLTQRGEEMLRDIDRVFHVLDGKPTPEYQQGVCAAIRTASANGEMGTETPYFRVRWFKNGNAHLWFLRADLVERANRLIAEHFGAVVGTSPQPFRGRSRKEPHRDRQTDSAHAPRGTAGGLGRDLLDTWGPEPRGQHAHLDGQQDTPGGPAAVPAVGSVAPQAGQVPPGEPAPAAAGGMG